MFGAVKSVDLKLKVGTNVWGEYKHHSNPYIHSTVDYTDRGHTENDRWGSPTFAPIKTLWSAKYSLQVDTIAVTSLINPRHMRSEGYSTWSVILFVCYHVFCHYTQQDGQKAIPTGSVPHWLDFKNGDLHTSTAFKSYGVKTKRTSQYANEHGLP